MSRRESKFDKILRAVVVLLVRTLPRVQEQRSWRGCRKRQPPHLPRRRTQKKKERGRQSRHTRQIPRPHRRPKIVPPPVTFFFSSLPFIARQRRPHSLTSLLDLGPWRPVRTPRPTRSPEDPSSRLVCAYNTHPWATDPELASVSSHGVNSPCRDSELKIVGEYGLRNKREVWRVALTLSKIRRAAR